MTPTVAVTNAPKKPAVSLCWLIRLATLEPSERGDSPDVAEPFGEGFSLGFIAHHAPLKLFASTCGEYRCCQQHQNVTLRTASQTSEPQELGPRGAMTSQARDGVRGRTTFTGPWVTSWREGRLHRFAHSYGGQPCAATPLRSGKPAMHEVRVSVVRPEAADHGVAELWPAEELISYTHLEDAT
jgi:hypothetical protein